MEHLKMHSPNMVDQNIEKLAELFPGCVTEAQGGDGKLRKAIDFDLLKQELSRHIVEGPQERYQLNWPGKREALLTANAPIAKTLRPCREESVNFDTTENLFIEGDNLDALKLLQETYLGKVKMIYIDPPYNTGNDFIYEDDFSEDVDSYIERSNQIDDEGNRLVTNSDSNGRFHSDWLSMLYSRIKLARNLLKDDGVIFVSIADHEVQNLRTIMDEIFGGSNFIATLIWQKVYAPKSSAKHFSEDHDYIIVFAKNASIWKPTLLPRTDDQNSKYKNPDNDPRGPWRPNNLAARNFYSKGTYSITCPSGRVISGPPNGSYWRVSEDRFKELDKDNRIWWGNDGNNVPAPKIFLSEVKDGRVPQTFLSYKEVGHTQEAKKELLSLVEFSNSGVVFDTPKPTRLMQHLLLVGTNPDEHSIVMDFFAGTGTLQSAVLKQNEEDGGKRKCILVQLPEPLEGSRKEDGLKTIADITKERLRKSGEAISLSNDSVGFRVLKIDSSNMADVYYQPDTMTQADLFAQVDNVKEDRTEEDLLFQVMLDWGVDLTLPIRREAVDGKTVFFVADNALVACFDKDSGINESFVKELAKCDPLRLVFRDAGFASDSTKINVEQVLKQLSPNTDVKSI